LKAMMSACANVILSATSMASAAAVATSILLSITADCVVYVEM
jgi:hypothetical protein